MRKSVFIPVIMLLNLIFPIYMASAGAAPATVFELAADRETLTVGQEITVTLQAGPVANLNAFDAVILFDPSKVEFVKVNPLLTGASGVSTRIADGRLVFGYHLNEGYAEGVARLAVLTFKGKATGVTAITLEQMNLIDTTPQTDGYKNVNKSIQVTVQTPQDTDPPNEPGPSPSPSPSPGSSPSPSLHPGRIGAEDVEKSELNNTLRLVVDQETVQERVKKVLETRNTMANELPPEQLGELSQLPAKEISLHTGNYSQKELELVLPGGAVNHLIANGFRFSVVTGTATLQIPPDSLHHLPDSGSMLEVKISTGLQTANSQAGLKQASNYFTFGAAVVHEDHTEQIDRFNEKPTIVLTYSGSQLQEDKLGIYYLNPETRIWEYAGGTVNKTNRTVITKVDRLGTYAVLEFDKSFDDIQEHWARQDIEILASRHVVDGIGNSLFAPDSTVTRAQFAKLIVQVLGLEGNDSKTVFRDVPADEWYAEAIGTASKYSLVEGANGLFRPEDPVSREEMAVIVMRAYAIMVEKQQPVASLSRFNDKGAISSWAEEPVGKAVSAGIIRGISDDSFAPKATATRAEASAVVRRLLNQLQ